MPYILILLFLYVQPDLHPIHISVSNVEIRPSSVEWTIRIYKDDLLLGLYGKKAGFEKLDDESKIKKDVLTYLEKHISFSASTALTNWQLQDIQADQEAIWTTLTSSFVFPENHTLEVRNEVLMKEYSDQKNIVHFTYNGETKSLIFEQGDDFKLVTL